MLLGNAAAQHVGKQSPALKAYEAKTVKLSWLFVLPLKMQ